jgi:predicted CXXCH cytochrome family protein
VTELRSQLQVLRRLRQWILACVALALLCSGATWLWLDRTGGHKLSPPGDQPSGSAAGASTVAGVYAGSANCQDCHAEEFALWQKSHHALAQRKPGPEDDTAFSPNRVVLSGIDQTLTRRNGTNYEVFPAGRTGEVLAVTGVLGVDPLRQFLVAFPQGKVQALAAAYDPRSNDWFNVNGNEERRPGEWGHWTGRGMNWNSMCADCHNTNVRKNYDASDDSYHTAMSEESVGCEACHGPLQQHGQWQRTLGRSTVKDPTLRRLSASQVLDSCGFCHARRGELTGNFQPGDAFLDHVRPEIVDASSTFYPDGQVREEDYEYAAFLGSRMHQRGVGCLDCHEPHSAKTKLPGNWLCLRCHNGTYPNAPVIEPMAHSHHKVFGSDDRGVQTNLDLTQYQSAKIQETGGECVNCHMPQTVYMQRHRRHDHGFTIPDPLLTKKAGVPNACNRCHQDKDAEWALKWCEDWYGSKMERPTRQRALLISAARRGEPEAAPGLLRMLSTNEIAYWRAAAAGLLGIWVRESRVQSGLLDGLRDSNALVRLECIRSLELVPEQPTIAGAFTRSLRDPSRAVRVAAAWALRETLDLSTTAGADLQQCLAVNADQPAGQMQLGAFALARGDSAKTIGHYQKAIEWDPGSAPLRHDYAVLLAGSHRTQEALEQLQVACRLEPTNAEFQYSLALAWNEAGRMTNTIDCLEAAVRLEPGFARAWYNLGLALESAGRSQEALDALVRAESADAGDARAPYARATILAQLERWSDAQKAARRALEIDPGLEAARDLLRQIDAVRTSK